LLTATAAGREFLAAWLPSSSSLLAAAGSEGLVTLPGIHHRVPPAESAARYTPQFFKPEEFQTVEVLTEMIIPTDEKPGAKEAQVANYVDFVVFSAAEYLPSLQRAWSEGLVLLNRETEKHYGGTFRKASPANREKLLTEMSLPERDPGTHHPGFAFYKLVKEMTVEGFYTSRIGLIEVLEYQGLTFLSEFPGCTHPEHQF
jgi:hypothetical protein